jgi:hypothetical protein
MEAKLILLKTIKTCKKKKKFTPLILILTSPKVQPNIHVVRCLVIQRKKNILNKLIQ